ncbi:transmembrane protein, putative (macronuclear) [Tetrahymena thermophila SB210]|uniref:Transmembrane protein, putative n=1 Tax=Tetrahymena thermophila (strain SB210) TaxID=312017 RepID=W7WXJ4_TETTS|nr:transmembrane protein, putative [Tetrahymena thermophila SB210]EWS71530.1 transmembrane protein, putative [Tetrahymena thermophila SB210]|eukprot:XP_012655941.1 transmembrane protein, putative [Tetrahymena thermophila SB210]
MQYLVLSIYKLYYWVVYYQFFYLVSCLFINQKHQQFNSVLERKLLLKKGMQGYNSQLFISFMWDRLFVQNFVFLNLLKNCRFFNQSRIYFLHTSDEEINNFCNQILAKLSICIGFSKMYVSFYLLLYCLINPICY